MTTVIKIVSGGQTGADRAAIDFAIAHGIEHGGFVPKGRRAEDGPISTAYNLIELSTAEYPPRTKMNIKVSDGTVIFTGGPIELERGSALTAFLSREMGKPHIAIDLSVTSLEDAATDVGRFVRDEEIVVLNVAGNRESRSPGIYDKVKRVLELAFGNL